MIRRSFAVAVAVIASLAVLPVTPAHAVADGQVAAAVTGKATASGDFEPGATITGLFVDAGGDDYLGDVTVTSAITFNSGPPVPIHPEVDPIVETIAATGTINSGGAFNGTNNHPLVGNETLTGSLDGGSFVRVGVVAIALIDLTFDIGGDNDGGTVTSVATIAAVPDPDSLPDVPPDFLVQGPVVGGA